MEFCAEFLPAGASRRSVALNGGITTRAAELEWSGMQSIRRRRKATTGASSTRPRRGRWSWRRPGPREFIFPYDPKSVGAAFTRACRILGIKDLRFHDLRHEAASRLFELGYEIHEVAQFTLHDSWNELKRYANLRPENLRDITAPAAPNGSPHPRRGDSSAGFPARSLRRSISSARSVALTSQGDFWPPRRNTRHGNNCVGARRRASSKLSPKYFGATFASGMLASPNSANNPK